MTVPENLVKRPETWEKMWRIEKLMLECVRSTLYGSAANAGTAKAPLPINRTF